MYMKINLVGGQYDVFYQESIVRVSLKRLRYVCSHPSSVVFLESLEASLSEMASDNQKI